MVAALSTGEDVGVVGAPVSVTKLNNQMGGRRGTDQAQQQASPAQPSRQRMCNPQTTQAGTAISPARVRAGTGRDTSSQLETDRQGGAGGEPAAAHVGDPTTSRDPKIGPVPIPSQPPGRFIPRRYEPKLFTTPTTNQYGPCWVCIGGRQRGQLADGAACRLPLLPTDFFLPPPDPTPGVR